MRTLDCLNNRHYNPVTGTFLSVDPLVAMTGEPYIYGSANPIKYSDPTGLCPQFTMDADGNWTCEFFPTGGPRIAVDNGPEERCNVGGVTCTVDQGKIPTDYVFQRPDGSRPKQHPEEYEGVPTGDLSYVPPSDPFDFDISTDVGGLLVDNTILDEGLAGLLRWAHLRASGVDSRPRVPTAVPPSVEPLLEDDFVQFVQCYTGVVGSGATAVSGTSLRITKDTGEAVAQRVVPVIGKSAAGGGPSVFACYHRD